MARKLRIIPILIRVVMVVLAVILALACIIRVPFFTVAIDDRTFDFVLTENLESHVKALSEQYVPRTCTQPEALQNTATYLKAEFGKFNSNTSFQRYTHGTSSFSNVVSEHGPDTKEVIIIGAHYDTFRPYPGADDNASGVAGLLELNRLLSTSNLARRVILVAYACEEPPHYASNGMGSVIHANSVADKEVILMISLEMIGYYSSEHNSQKFPIPALSFLYPDKGNFIAVVGKIFSLEAGRLKSTINRFTDIDAYSINAPTSIQGIDFSDHRSYWAQDYPAVMVTDTAYYRNRHYHQPSDTHEKLNYKQMARVVYGVFIHTLTLANEQPGASAPPDLPPL